MKKQAQTRTSVELLSTIVAFLRYLSLMYHNHHWESKGRNFYEDHLLFERLYNQMSEQIDKIAEKSIGLFGSEIVNFSKQLILIKELDAKFPYHSPEEAIKHSLMVEKELTKLIENVAGKLEMNGELSLGLDNLLAELCDNSENRCYLLGQVEI